MEAGPRLGLHFWTLGFALDPPQLLWPLVGAELRPERAPRPLSPLPPSQCECVSPSVILP